MSDLLKKVQSTDIATTRSSSTGNVGAGAAMRSLGHLQQIEAGDTATSGKIKMAVVATLLGLSLVGFVKPAHADTTQGNAPPPTQLFLDGHMPTGPPDYAKLLGSTTTDTVGASIIARRTVDPRTQAAFDQFEARLTQILQRDAGSLAAGLKPIQNGDSLDATKTKELERALGDLVKELPVNVLSQDVRGALEQLLGRNLENARLGELGDHGSDAARDLVKRLKSESPKTFWSLAGTAAAAAVAVGYTQGTDGLEKLGIKPQLSTRIFDETKLKLGLEAEARFKDARLAIGLETTHTFEGGTVVKGGVSAQVHAKQFVSAELKGTVTTTSQLYVDGAVRLDGSGKPFDARLSVHQSFTHDVAGGGNGVVFAGAQWSDGTNGTTKQGLVTLGAGATHGRWTTSVSGSYDLTNDRFTSTLATGRTYDVNTRNDLDVQLRATHDSKGTTHVGVGVTLRF